MAKDKDKKEVFRFLVLSLYKSAILIWDNGNGLILSLSQSTEASRLEGLDS